MRSQVLSLLLVLGCSSALPPAHDAVASGPEANEQAAEPPPPGVERPKQGSSVSAVPGKSLSALRSKAEALTGVPHECMASEWFATDRDRHDLGDALHVVPTHRLLAFVELLLNWEQVIPRPVAVSDGFTDHVITLLGTDLDLDFVRFMDVSPSGSPTFLAKGLNEAGVEAVSKDGVTWQAPANQVSKVLGAICLPQSDAKVIAEFVSDLLVDEAALLRRMRVVQKSEPESRVVEELRLDTLARALSEGGRPMSDAALPLWRITAQLYPKSAPASFMLGQGFVRANGRAAAVTEFRRTLTLIGQDSAMPADEKTAFRARVAEYISSLEPAERQTP
jgi:hypothetical protein